jgi:cell division protein FtsB
MKFLVLAALASSDILSYLQMSRARIEIQPDLKAILDASGTMLNWALIVVGGSIAALINTTAERPKTSKGRWIYISLIPAWICLGMSLYYGFSISRNYIAAVVTTDSLNMVNDNLGRPMPLLNSMRAAHDNSEQQKTLLNRLDDISDEVNDNFANQMRLLQWGLLSLALWLILFLFWFVFFGGSTSSLTDAQRAAAEKTAAQLAAQDAGNAKIAAEEAAQNADKSRIAAERSANEAKSESAKSRTKKGEQ